MDLLLPIIVRVQLSSKVHVQSVASMNEKLDSCIWILSTSVSVLISSNSSISSREEQDHLVVNAVHDDRS